MSDTVRQGRTWGLFGMGMALVLVAGVLLIGGNQILAKLGLSQAGKNNAPQINALAPDFRLTSLQGEKVSLSSMRGKPVVINFWATWCAPCVEEMPSIQRFYEKHPGEFEVLAVNADEPEGDVRQFVEDMGLTFNVLLDPGGKTQELYRLRGYPTTFFLDAEGVIRSEHIGQLHGEQFADYMSNLGIGE